MQLIISRRWDKNQRMDRGSVSCRILLTEEEHDLIETYDLWRDQIRVGESGKVVDFVHGVTIGSLTSGVASLFHDEDEILRRLDQLSELLNRCRSFREETVVEFPRDRKIH